MSEAEGASFQIAATLGLVVTFDDWRLACAKAGTPASERAVRAALNPEADDLRAGAHALRLLEAAEPREQATLTVSTEVDVESMSLGELIAFAQANGIAVPEATPPELTAPDPS